MQELVPLETSKKTHGGANSTFRDSGTIWHDWGTNRAWIQYKTAEDLEAEHRRIGVVHVLHLTQCSACDEASQAARISARASSLKDWLASRVSKRLDLDGAYIGVWNMNN